MARAPGSYIKEKGKPLKPNDKCPAMQARKVKRSGSDDVKAKRDAQAPNQEVTHAVPKK